jgi:hypothetical protein
MPEGFAFPFSEQIWTPLRVDPRKFGATGKAEAGPGRPNLLGRLASGISLADAQAELDGMAERLGPNSPEALRQAGPRIMPYGRILVGPEPGPEIAAMFYSLHILVVLLLAIVCSSVATLVFARTATRAWEITVRNALGASRWRIVSQLFIEALVLAGLGAVVGIAGAVASNNAVLRSPSAGKWSSVLAPRPRYVAVDDRICGNPDVDRRVHCRGPAWTPIDAARPASGASA